MFQDRRWTQSPEFDEQLDLGRAVAVDREYRYLLVFATQHGRGMDRLDVSVSGGADRGGLRFRRQNRAPAVPGGQRERIVVVFSRAAT